jgi:hypothetical protein
LAHFGWGLEELVPGAIEALEVSTNSLERLVLDWDAPSSNGQAPLTDYLITFSRNSGATWTTFPDGVSTATSLSIAYPLANTTYIFRAQAVNKFGSGPAAQVQFTTPVR